MLNYLQEVILTLYVFFITTEVCLHVVLGNIASALGIHGPEELDYIEGLVERQ